MGAHGLAVANRVCGFLEPRHTVIPDRSIEAHGGLHRDRDGQRMSVSTIAVVATSVAVGAFAGAHAKTRGASAR